MKEFSLREKDFEVRSCNNMLLSSGEHTTVEIVEWNGDHCITVAYFIKTEDGFDLKSVGERILRLMEKPKIARKLIQTGFKMLEDGLTRF